MLARRQPDRPGLRHIRLGQQLIKLVAHGPGLQRDVVDMGQQQLICQLARPGPHRGHQIRNVAQGCNVGAQGVDVNLAVISIELLEAAIVDGLGQAAQRPISRLELGFDDIRARFEVDLGHGVGHAEAGIHPLLLDDQHLLARGGNIGLPFACLALDAGNHLVLNLLDRVGAQTRSAQDQRDLVQALDRGHLRIRQRLGRQRLDRGHGRGEKFPVDGIFGLFLCFPRFCFRVIDLLSVIEISIGLSLGIDTGTGTAGTIDGIGTRRLRRSNRDSGPSSIPGDIVLIVGIRGVHGIHGTTIRLSDDGSAIVVIIAIIVASTLVDGILVIALHAQVELPGIHRIHDLLAFGGRLLRPGQRVGARVDVDDHRRLVAAIGLLFPGEDLHHLNGRTHVEARHPARDPVQAFDAGGPGQRRAHHPAEHLRDRRGVVKGAHGHQDLRTRAIPARRHSILDDEDAHHLPAGHVLRGDLLDLDGADLDVRPVGDDVGDVLRGEVLQPRARRTHHRADELVFGPQRTRIIAIG